MLYEVITVLSADKLLTLYQSEMKFRRHLLDGIGGHKKGAHCGSLHKVVD